MKVGDFVHITRKENGAKSRMDPEDVALMQARIPHTGIVVYIHPVGHWATVLCMSDSGKAVHIDIDNRRQKTTVYTFDWIRGGPANFKKIIELKDDIVGAVEVPSLMERLGIKIKEAQQ